MIADRNKGKTSSNPSKELQRLRREDLLELLLEQMRENDEQRAAVAANRATVVELNAQIDRLKAILSARDALLEEVYSHLHELVRASSPRERRQALLMIEDLLAGRLISQLGQYYDVNPAVVRPEEVPVPEEEAAE